MKIRTHGLRYFRFALISTPALIGAAEPQSSDSRRPDVGDEVAVLSPFTVSDEKDFGYRASNSITATGIGTAIRDVPANIAVITNDFLKDKGLSELRYAVNNVSSVDTDTRDYNRLQINVRGFAALIQQNGNDNSFLALDNVDRVEVIKGPSAVFHGIVRPGGVINVIKAMPEFTPKSYVETKFGSYDYFKTELRTTGPLVADKLAYSIYGSYLDKGGRVDYTFNRAKFVAGGLKWTPTRRISSVLDFEFKDEVYEGAPEELAISHPAYIAAVNAGTVPYLQTARAWLDANPAYGPNVPMGQVFVTDQVFSRKNFNTAGPDAPTTEKGYTARSETTAEMARNLNVRLLLTQADLETALLDHNTFRPVAGASPGSLVYNTRYQLTNTDSQTSTGKVEVSYQFEYKGIKQSVLVGASEQVNKTYNQVLFGAFKVWNPRTDPARSGLGELRAAYPNGQPAHPPFLKSKTRGLYVADQITALRDRLHVVLGARYTLAKNATNLEQTKTTPQVGVLYRLVDPISLYANYSETFEPNYILDAFGKQVGPSTGKGTDVGVKTEFFDNKLSATVAVYQVERGNIPVRDFPQENALGITPIYNLGGLERSAGAELDLIYSPTRNYQFTASYTNSWKHHTITNSDPRQNGIPLANVPRQVFNVWNKYTFVAGPVKGLYVGAGLKAQSSGAHLHPSYDVALYGDSYITIDAMLGYEWKVGRARVDARLNLINLTSEKYYPGVYSLSDPFNGYLTVRVSF